MTAVAVIGAATPTYTSRLDSGRVIVDVSDDDAETIPAITEKTGVVGGVMTEVSKTSTGSLTRVSIALTKDATYRVRVDGNTFRVWLSPSETIGDKVASMASNTSVDRGLFSPQS